MYTHQVVIDVAFKQFLVMPEWMEVLCMHIYVDMCIYMHIYVHMHLDSSSSGWRSVQQLLVTR